MQRVIDEAQYVLGVLHQMKYETSANPDWFDPDASKRINEAIARIEDGLYRVQLMVCEAKRTCELPNQPKPQASGQRKA